MLLHGIFLLALHCNWIVVKILKCLNDDDNDNDNDDDDDNDNDDGSNCCGEPVQVVIEAAWTSWCWLT